MENVRKRRNIKLVKDLNAFSKFASHPLYIQHTIVDETLVALELYKPKILLNKLIFVGQAVLDYSKLEMYELYYETFKKCPLINKTRLCGGDTDSFFLCLYSSPSISLNDIFLHMRDKFDSSNYDDNHPLFTSENRAKLECFKDECDGCPLEEFILLKPKMYSIKYLNEKTSIKRAKGIQKSVVSSFTHVNYSDVYHDCFESEETLTLIQSKNHKVSTVEKKTRGLSLWEDKRFWIEKNFSLPYGHYALNTLPPQKRRRILPICGDRS